VSASAIHHLVDLFDLGFTELGLPAAGAASGTGGHKTGPRALTDQVALELGERCKDVKHQLACRAARLDLLGQALEADALLFQLANDAHEVWQTATKAIQSPHHKGVTLAQRLEAGQQFLAVGILAARGVGVEAVVGNASLAQRVVLQIKVLVICRDSGVPDSLPHWPIPAFQTQKMSSKGVFAGR
jgi:hypothetical protein